MTPDPKDGIRSVDRTTNCRKQLVGSNEAADAYSVRSTNPTEQDESSSPPSRSRQAVVHFPSRPGFEEQKSFCKFGIDQPLVLDFVRKDGLSYEDKENVHSMVTMDPIKVRNHYLAGWFMVDFISSCPVDNLILPFIHLNSTDKHLSSSRTVYIAKFLALLRLLRICRLVRYLSRCQESFYTSSSWIYIRILNLSLLMLLVAHWNACLQFLVNFCLGFPDRCWIAQSNLQDAEWFEQWCWSLFNSVSQMFSISYGRVTPDTLVDVWFTMVGMLTGASVYALILANIATMWQHADVSRKLHRHKMREVEDYMSFRRFPRELRTRVRDYFERRYRGHVFNEDDILESMSDPLRESVMLHNCHATIRMVPFFATAEPAFINELVTKLRFDFYQPEDVIVSEGTIGTKMFFLQTGKVSVLNQDGRSLATLEDGSYFGELCLLIQCKRNAIVKAKTHCSIFTLGYEEFHEVLSRFPLIRSALETLTNDILETRERTMSAIQDNDETVASWSEFAARASKEDLRRVEIDKMCSDHFKGS
ncbi:potassium/sodium hyperpolarization-activated cyclic nucleotide-gated channel 2-like isoform X2 [Varroa jacobsoni]|uniref:Cyclic nucleotide-binding domain-containing protein n=1 Tax=Varroa destructor TaxID=109461 RepID=A0A7M7KVF4_VARDE|nr:potassium/sodium hyperpolarization-activated cyclic nucleotide-gated channel 2-like isoform X4 [Varroa destructor]XP_022702222.1 potassium/sodium hyperpolarization-activated cyclic nucleotide-gated channel 2-like isoform X2 [Varroa jacobsoni]